MIPVPVTLSWDSLFASFFLGFSAPSRARQIRFAAALGVLDAAASWAAARPSFASGWLSPVAIPDLSFFICIYCLAICSLPVLIHTRLGRPWLYCLPFLLCLDNLANPAATELSFLGVLSLGVISSAMSAFGFSLARIMRVPLLKLCDSNPALRFLP